MDNSRKRPSSPEDAGPSFSKKRALNSPSHSPVHVNGTASPVSEHEPQENDDLETFRKEAIFRRMRYHAREHQRAEDKVADLSKRKHALESAMSALESCWNQLLDQLQLLVKADSLPTASEPGIKNLLELVELHSSDSGSISQEFTNALRLSSMNTQRIITAFVQMAPTAPTPEYDELRIRARNHAAEATSLRSELHITHASLVDSKADLDKYKELLSAAEASVDRARSDSVLAMERRSAAVKPSSETRKVDVKEEDNVDRVATPTVSHANGHSHGDPSLEDYSLRVLAQEREENLQKASAENLLLQEQVNELKSQAATEDILNNSPSYKALKEQLAALNEEIARAHADRDSSIQQYDELATKSAEDLALAVAERNAQSRDQEDLLKKKNKEAARLRDQREDALHELNQLKAREGKKAANTSETATMRAQALEDRVAALSSEVKRLKGKLAAHSGDEDLLSFFMTNSDENLTFVQDLRNKLKAAQNKVSGLESTLKQLNQSNPDLAFHVQAEARAKQEAAELKEKLAKYEQTFGDSLSPEAAALSEQLREKEAALQKLRLAQKQEEAASNDLFDELQRMSTAWETLDKQSKSKVDEISALETKLNKTAVEKAKADAKYFAAMREKEASDLERKTSLRGFQKQSVLLAKMTESEKSLTTQVSLLEQETMAQKAALRTYQDKLDALERESMELKARHDSETLRSESLREQMKSREEYAEKKKTEARKLREELTTVKKTSEREISRAKMASTSTGAATQREEALQDEIGKLMQILRCSTCRQELKTHVLLKCMHTFCKSCIDARVSTRQRKCPACNMAFSTSDIQALYFQ